MKHLTIKQRLVALAGILAIATAFALPAVKNAMAVAQDCDANAIIWCGAQTKAELTGRMTNGDGHNSASSINQIYAERGITAAGINSSDTVEGSVNNKGEVIVGGRVVATNVWSSGRQFIPGSVKDGSIYMRPTSVSFRSQSLPAFVNMSGGTFKWAIIKSCGNPVKQIAKPFPVIYKHVIDTAKPGTSYAADDAAHAVEVASNGLIQYEITVNNGGTAPMENVVLTDDLPAGVQLVSDPAMRRITANLGTIPAGGLKTYTVGLTKGVEVTAASGLIDNVACANATGVQQVCDHAVIKVKAPQLTPPKEQPPKEQPPKEQPPKEQPPKECKVNCEQPPKECEVNCDNDKPECKVNCDNDKPKCEQNCDNDKPQCKVNCVSVPPTTPPAPPVGGGQLPDTGVEGTAAGLMGTGALGYTARAYLRSKRGLVGALRSTNR